MCPAVQPWRRVSRRPQELSRILHDLVAEVRKKLRTERESAEALSHYDLGATKAAGGFPLRTSPRARAKLAAVTDAFAILSGALV